MNREFQNYYTHCTIIVCLIRGVIRNGSIVCELLTRVREIFKNACTSFPILFRGVLQRVSTTKGIGTKGIVTKGFDYKGYRKQKMSITKGFRSMPPNLPSRSARPCLAATLSPLLLITKGFRSMPPSLHSSSAHIGSATRKVNSNYWPMVA